MIELHYVSGAAGHLGGEKCGSTPAKEIEHYVLFLCGIQESAAGEPDRFLCGMFRFTVPADFPQSASIVFEKEEILLA